MAKTRNGRGVVPALLASFIREAGLDYWENQNSFVFACPKCNRPDKLYIRKSDGQFKCWVCAETQGFKGRAEFALKELVRGQTLKEIRDIINGDAAPQASGLLELGLDGEDEDDDDFYDLIPETLPEVEWDYRCLPIEHPKALPGQQYLEGRGLPLELQRRYAVRYNVESRAVAFPVVVNGALMGWQYRIIDSTPGRLKTWSSDGLPRDRVVMFADQLKTSRHAVICEGPVDALKADLVGGNVATMGKSIAARQVEFVLGFPNIEKIYLALDPDAAGEIEPLLLKLGDIPTYLVEIPEIRGQKADLGALTLEQARDVILSARRIRRGQIHIYLKE